MKLPNAGGAIVGAAVLAAAFGPAGEANGQALSALTCSFESQHLASSEPGSWIGLEKGNSTTLTFTDIDLARLTARIAQSPGTGEIRVVKGTGTLTFLEIGPLGGVIATTVVMGGADPPTRSMNAAHSRHVVTADGEVTVAQYIGFCEAG
jgi:hypothetical protein